MAPHTNAPVQTPHSLASGNRYILSLYLLRLTGPDKSGGDFDIFIAAPGKVDHDVVVGLGLDGEFEGFGDGVRGLDRSDDPLVMGKEAQGVEGLDVTGDGISDAGAFFPVCVLGAGDGVGQGAGGGVDRQWLALIVPQ